MLILTTATPDDESFLLELYSSVRSEEIDAFGWNEAQKQAFLGMQFQMQQRSYRMQYPDAEHRIVRLDGRPIGRIMTARLPQANVLVDISLLPAYRNRGLGTQLLRELQTQSAAEGKPLQLHVLRGNRAKGLYERLGFSQTEAGEMYEAMEWQQANK
ncbi:GNAT family N-acetyltransferase [Paenibacillus rigui]|uniref:GNAT family N-acetyltransferase n=1 Tax=Paenibacillus rigui TaxID=554312 RepID=A0A229UR34_9BACL|nr:GNAT family N-acetyltransferase [Paenibacillus rigui]OXM85711.1 GNAT family N-acetyltransferase [Paenibacillus rigui]